MSDLSDITSNFEDEVLNNIMNKSSVGNSSLIGSFETAQKTQDINVDQLHELSRQITLSKSNNMQQKKVSFDNPNTKLPQNASNIGVTPIDTTPKQPKIQNVSHHQTDGSRVQNANIGQKQRPVLKKSVQNDSVKVIDEVINDAIIKSDTTFTPDMINLMGLSIPKQTLYLLVVLIVIAIAYYYMTSTDKQKKKNKKDEDDEE